MKLELITTNISGKTRSSAVPFQEDAQEVELQVVNLYPEITFQTLDGFGAAITDVSGYVYSLMNGEQRRQVIERRFHGIVEFRRV